MLLDNSSVVCKYVSTDTICDSFELYRDSIRQIMGDFVKNNHASEFPGVLLTVDQLARLLHKSPASIYSDVSRNLKALPPICRLPGTKRLFWRPEDVTAWMARFVEHSPIQEPRAVALDVPRRRGRPRKTELRVPA